VATPTVAAPTAAPPTTARRVVRRATPATLTGVPGRPTRACALLTDNERPWLCDQSTEPKTPQTTTAAIKNVCFKPTRFIATSLKERLAINLQSLICSRVNPAGQTQSQSSGFRSPPIEHVSAAYPCIACAGNSRATSVHGTFETCRLHRAMSAFEGNAEVHLLTLSFSHFDPYATLAAPPLSLVQSPIDSRSAHSRL
jgi:hypothetical protein